MQATLLQDLPVSQKPSRGELLRFRKKEIEILRMHYLAGPNLWAYRPVLEALVDIGALEDFPSNLLPGFNDRLGAWLPGLVEHRCSYGVRGGFLRRLEEGTWAGHILEHVTLELQGMAGMPAGFGKARETSRRGVYKVVVRAMTEPLAKASLETARDLMMAAILDRPFDVSGEVRRLANIAALSAPDADASSILDAAGALGIPSMKISPKLIQLGYGVRQRRIWSSMTDATSAISEGISRDPELTQRLLSTCGLPVADEAKGRKFSLLVAGGKLAAALEIGEDGNSRDVTESVHPDLGFDACLAARIVGLDIASVELLAQDISLPFSAQQGGVLEVHASPSLSAHMNPDHGEARPVGKIVAQSLFGEGENGRIPIVGIAGTGENGTASRLLAWLMRVDGMRVGLACESGFYLGARQAEKGDCSDLRHSRKVLMNREVEAAVLAVGPRSMLSEGLAYDRCLVGVVTGIGRDAQIAEYDLYGAEEMAKVLRTQVDVVLPEGAAVLNAGDEAVAQLARFCDGEVIHYHAGAENAVISSHLDAGGRAVFLKRGAIVLGEGKKRTVLVDAAALAEYSDMNGVLAAVAAAVALGIPHSILRNGVESFGREGF